MANTIEKENKKMLKDSTGKILKAGDTVLVPNPKKNDMWNHGFVGQVDGFRYNDVVVVDGEGDCFQIESNRLEYQED